MPDYEIVTRQQAAKFLSYVKGESTVQVNHLLFSVESSLSVQKDKLLQTELYYDKDTGLMDEAVAKSYFEIEKNIAMCQILKLGLNSLPVVKQRPKILTKTYPDSCRQLIKIFDLQETEAELMNAKKLLAEYKRPKLWSQIVADNPELKIKTLSFFFQGSGKKFLETQIKKYEL
jgi:hypothetical protein